MKKYENLIEMAFRFVEHIDNVPLLHNYLSDVIPFLDLKAAVETLKEYHAAEEPIFVLRGHDRVAPRAIVAWGQFVSSASATALAGEHASQENDKMLAWQEAHPDLVKMPD